LKHGSVYQRHAAGCPRAEGGGYAPHRCRGSWSYIIDLGTDTSGTRRQMGKGGFPTKAAARSALQEISSLLLTDVNVQNMKVGEYLENWLAGKHSLKPKTVSLYRDALDLYLIPHLGHIGLLELRAHHLDRFYAAITIGKRGKPLSPSSIRRIHAALRSALNTAVKRRLIPYNPALHVELAPENPHRPKPWTADQCQTFLGKIREDRLSTLYHIMIVTGLRRGEAIGLRWEDVDLESHCLFVTQQITEVRGKLVVGTPKTRRGRRVVPIDALTVDLLRDQLRDQDTERAAWGDASRHQDLVFCREDGHPLRPEYVTRHFQALAKKAGLPAIRLHDLRHTNASLALAAGIDIKVVSDRLGHSTMAVTADLYTHVVPSLGRDAAKRIAGLLGDGAQANAYEMPTSKAQKGPERRSDHASLQVDGARPKGFEPPTF
jgi:integrase